MLVWNSLRAKFSGLDPGGGQVLSFYSNNLSSNQAKVYNFYCLKMFEKN